MQNLKKQITFTEQAKQRLKRYLSPKKKLILDFDDGVGPFSAIGNCDLEANYKLIFVDRQFDTPDFDETVFSNLGDIFIKSELYANVQFEPKMQIDFDQHHYSFTLTSPTKQLTDSLEVIDLPIDYQAPVFSKTQDC